MSPDNDQVPNGQQLIDDDARPTTELLCLCTRPGNAQHLDDWIRGLVATCDPDRFIRSAIEQHRVAPIVTETFQGIVNRKSDVDIPASILDSLQQESHRIAIWNHLQTVGLLDVLDILEDSGIPAIPFKGPVLAAQVYDGIERRQFVDLDIMVPSARLMDADKALRDAGFESRLLPNSTERRLQRRRGGHFNLRRDSLQVELHSQLKPTRIGAPINHRWLAKHTTDVDLRGRTVPGLEPEPLLIFLCIHGISHRWRRLKWLCDVAYLVQTMDVDWKLLAKIAKRLGRCRAVDSGLLLAAELLDASIPWEVLSEARNDRVAVSVVSRIRRRILTQNSGGTGDGTGVGPTISRLLAESRLLDERWERLIHFGQFFFQPKPVDADAVTLPPSLEFAYSLIRPLRLGYLAVRLYAGDGD